MCSDKSTDVDESNLQPIPEEMQDLSLEEITDADYEVVSSTTESSDNDEVTGRRYHGRITPPGRVWDEDSIDASSEDPRGTEQGYIFTGYDTTAATWIGEEESADPDRVERLRQLNEGRHRSDGSHSVRESQRDKKRIAQALCDSLPLANHEREKVVSVVQQLNFEEFGYQKGIQSVVLGAVAVVIDEYVRPPDSLDDAIRRTEEFAQLKETLDASMSDRSTIKRVIRDQIESGKVSIPKGESVPRRDPALPKPGSRRPQPAEDWEHLSPEYWVSLARHWESADDQLKSALPVGKRNLITQLRQWEPWNIGDDEDDGSTQYNPGSDESETSLEELSEEVVEEVIEATEPESDE